MWGSQKIFHFLGSRIQRNFNEIFQSALTSTIMKTSYEKLAVVAEGVIVD